MTELIMRLRKCADELSKIADELVAVERATAAAEAGDGGPELADDVRRIVDVLAQFGVIAKVERVCRGPAFSEVEISVSPGTRCERVTALSGTLLMALERHAIRVVAPIPGTCRIGIEYDRDDPEPVTFADTVLPEVRRPDGPLSRAALPVVVGKDVEGATVSFDLARMPHVLVGGAVGQGAAAFLDGLINGLVVSRSPEEVRLILLDRKFVELDAYGKLPHLLMPLIHDTAKALSALRWALVEMDSRLKLFSRVAVRNLQDYNARERTEEGRRTGLPETLPYIVIVVNEFADLMEECGKQVVPLVARLTALARATGIHLVLMTQSLDRRVVTGMVKANVPGRIAFKTANASDSLLLIDEAGAEDLIGGGDCLYRDHEGRLQHVQIPGLTDEEIAANVQAAIARYSASEYRLALPKTIHHGGVVPATCHESVEFDSMDTLVKKAEEIIRETGRATAAHLQRRMKLGYLKASRVIAELERRGVIGPARPNSSREIIPDKMP